MREQLNAIPLRVVILALLASAGLFIRIQAARHNVYPSVDGVYYLEQSRSLVLHHRLPFSSFPPGWPALAALPLFFADATDAQHVFRAAQGANIVLGVLWCVLTYRLLRRDLPEWGALTGAAVLLALPAAIIAAKGDLSDTSFGVMLVTAFLLRPRRPSWAGFALGFAYLIRPEALLVLLGLAAADTWRQRRLPWRFLAGGAIWVIAYAAFIHQSTGSWALTGKMGFLSQTWQENPGPRLFGLLWRNLVSFLPMLPAMLGLPMVLLAALGGWRRPRQAYLAFLGLALLPFFDFAMSGRYWLPYVPFVLLAAGHGVATATLRLKRWSPRPVAVAAVVLMVSGTAAVSRDELHWVRYNPNAYDGIRDSGLWLHGRVTESTRVAAYKPFASFWAGCAFVKYPDNADIMSLLDTLEVQGVEYLVVNAHVARVFVPALQSLLGRDVPLQIKARVEPLKIFNPGPADQFTVVYRLRSRATTR